MNTIDQIDHMIKYFNKTIESEITKLETCLFVHGDIFTELDNAISECDKYMTDAVAHDRIKILKSVHTLKPLGYLIFFEPVIKIKNEITNIINKVEFKIKKHESKQLNHTLDESERIKHITETDIILFKLLINELKRLDLRIEKEFNKFKNENSSSSSIPEMKIEYGDIIKYINYIKQVQTNTTKYKRINTPFKKLINQLKEKNEIYTTYGICQILELINEINKLNKMYAFKI